MRHIRLLFVLVWVPFSLHAELGNPSDLPSPSFQQIRDGSYDHKTVRVCGTVLDARHDEISPNLLVVIITRDDSSVAVTAKSDGRTDIDCDALIGQKISVTGTCTPRLHGTHFFAARSVYTTADQLIAAENTRHDPFDVPNLDISSPAGSEAVRRFERRRVCGLVIATWYAKRVLVRMPEGNLVDVVVSHGNLPPIGTAIEAVGIPSPSPFHRRISRCLWRPANIVLPAEKPAARTSIRLLTRDDRDRPHYDPALHGKRVLLTGRLRGAASPDGENDRILLEDDGCFLPVYLRPDIARELPVDSLLEVDGTCILDISSWVPERPFPEVSEMTLSVARPEDIRILEGPPWWTPAKFTTVCVALFTVLCGIVLWNLTLNRIVARKSRLLKREITARLASNLKTRERTRLAVELHDSIAQTLSGTAMEIGSALRCAGNASPAMLTHLQTASQTLRSCRDDLRDCLWDLRSNALEVGTMDEAIKTTLRPIVGNLTPIIRFNVLRKRLSDNTAHALLRIIHELVSNAIRHGQARTIRIAGSLDGRRLLFSVRDDGCGFDTGSHPDATTGHFGLEGIRERIRHFNGTMEIDSTPADGTKVTIALDVSSPEEEDLIET